MYSLDFAIAKSFGRAAPAIPTSGSSAAEPIGPRCGPRAMHQERAYPGGWTTGGRQGHVDGCCAPAHMPKASHPVAHRGPPSGPDALRLPQVCSFPPAGAAPCGRGQPRPLDNAWRRCPAPRASPLASRARRGPARRRWEAAQASGGRGAQPHAEEAPAGAGPEAGGSWSSPACGGLLLLPLKN